ncbi:phosphatidylinositol 3 and 4-kinase-domain-containing protein [Polychytrium aggregatum]|uniref:phosphatidylinositol 3 and 4-kinase-domain-containing protein n=1 Tax=Polychytrium aggregatum TaxID=110093 RepID=UPI0022FE8C5E|nr:phosphatidylinositol 3 and 4-kinase-domain-containing protein [Polychytrium aggregatum]KAI9207321.1 phosphatidylinositol 3 and 4-kinase-domain-containing protein [Polychytrium aggregatum]
MGGWPHRTSLAIHRSLACQSLSLVCRVRRSCLSDAAISLVGAVFLFLSLHPEPPSSWCWPCALSRRWTLGLLPPNCTLHLWCPSPFRPAILFHIPSPSPLRCSPITMASNSSSPAPPIPEPPAHPSPSTCDSNTPHPYPHSSAEHPDRRSEGDMDDTQADSSVTSPLLRDSDGNYHVDPGSRLTRHAHTPSIMDIHETGVFAGPRAAADSLVDPPKSWIPVVPPVTPVSATQFLEIVEEVRAAIDEGIYPTRIAQGSSGSYFCRNRQGEIVGVFKPKNEEPYGHLNPKWVKWLHKNLLPCCFGRSCLIPNLGYISEAAASYMDRRLQLNIVPRTEIVRLASPTFSYSTRDRRAYESGKALPLKIGSFQLFLKGYKDATTFFREGYTQSLRSDGGYASNNNSSTSLANVGDPSSSSSSLATAPTPPAADGIWSRGAQNDFRWGFERLVILDYLIRNTDRGSDNWMVRVNEEPRMVRKKSSSESIFSFAYEAGKIGYGFITGSNAPTLVSPDAAAEQVAAAATIVAHTRTKGKQVVGDAAAASVPLLSAFEALTTADSVAGGSEAAVANAAHRGSEPSLHRPALLQVPAEALAQTLPPPERLPTIQIAAIDNGLAFPFKHPDQWRSYPYGWANLGIARIPFSNETREGCLHLLTSQQWWQETMRGLEQLFRLDPDFSPRMFKRQKAVIRGQGYNLVEMLRRSELAAADAPGLPADIAWVQNGSPYDLIRRPLVTVDEYDDEEDPDGIDFRHHPHDYHGWKKVKRTFTTFASKQPCCTWC